MMAYIRTYNESSYVYGGRGVGTPIDSFDKVGAGAASFAVGGPGYFLSKALMERILPLLSTCSRFTGSLHFSDARVAHCIHLAFLPQCRVCDGELWRCWMMQPYYEGAPGVGLKANESLPDR